MDTLNGSAAGASGTHSSHWRVGTGAGVLWRASHASHANLAKRHTQAACELRIAAPIGRHDDVRGCSIAHVPECA